MCSQLFFRDFPFFSRYNGVVNQRRTQQKMNTHLSHRRHPVYSRGTGRKTLYAGYTRLVNTKGAYSSIFAPRRNSSYKNYVRTHTDKSTLYMTRSSAVEWGPRNPRDDGFDSRPGLNERHIQQKNIYAEG